MTKCDIGSRERGVKNAILRMKSFWMTPKQLRMINVKNHNSLLLSTPTQTLRQFHQNIWFLKWNKWFSPLSVSYLIHPQMNALHKTMELVKDLPAFFVLIMSQNLALLMDVKIAQLTFTCSKPTIETLEKGVKYVQS